MNRRGFIGRLLGAVGALFGLEKMAKADDYKWEVEWPTHQLNIPDKQGGIWQYRYGTNYVDEEVTLDKDGYATITRKGSFISEFAYAIWLASHVDTEWQKRHPGGFYIHDYWEKSKFVERGAENKRFEWREVMTQVPLDVFRFVYPTGKDPEPSYYIKGGFIGAVIEQEEHLRELLASVSDMDLIWRF